MLSYVVCVCVCVYHIICYIICRARWQVREKEWFQARMALEREVEMLKTELQRHDNQAKRWTEEREQVSSVSSCTHFTCFTGTKVQILTLLSSVAEEGGGLAGAAGGGRGGGGRGGGEGVGTIFCGKPGKKEGGA